MSKRRTGIAGAAGALGVAAIAMVASHADASACGGNKSSVNAPITCTVTKNGITSTMEVTADGHITVTYSYPPAQEGDWVQVIAHDGLSGAGGPENHLAQAVAAGSTGVTVSLLASKCGGQDDVKYVHGGTVTTDHVDKQWRIQAPVINIPLCGQETTTSANATTSQAPPSTQAPPSSGLLIPTTVPRPTGFSPADTFPPTL